VIHSTASIAVWAMVLAAACATTPKSAEPFKPTPEPADVTACAFLGDQARLTQARTMLSVDPALNAYRAGQVLSAACTDGFQAACEELRLRFKGPGPLFSRSGFVGEVLDEARWCGAFELRLSCDVSTTGRLERCGIDSPQARITQAAQAVAKRTALRPATVDGLPFKSDFKVEGVGTTDCGVGR